MNSRSLFAVSLFVGLGVSGCGATLQRDRVTLTPEYAASKVSIHDEHNSPFYCNFEMSGRGPRMWPTDPVPPAFEVVVGRELFVDYGTNPLPCESALQHDYMAAVSFDLRSIARAHWLVERSVLRMRRDNTAHAISLGRRASECTPFVLAPTMEWTRGSFVCDETNDDANPPATRISDRASRSVVSVRNSADPSYVTQQVEVTDFVNSALLHAASLFHGFLISPRGSSRHVVYLAGEHTLPPESSCTGLLSQFELELSLVRATR